MKLTKEETALILKKRKEENENKPKFSGVLKHDLHLFNGFDTRMTIDFSEILSKNSWFLTDEYLAYMIEKFKDELAEFLIIKEGSLFDCYNENGKESWYDSVNFGAEGMSAEWARNNLKDIKEVE